MMLRKSFQCSRNLFLRQSSLIRSFSSSTSPSSSPSEPELQPSATEKKKNSEPNNDLKLLYECDGSRNIRFVALATGINFTVCHHSSSSISSPTQYWGLNVGFSIYDNLMKGLYTLPEIIQVKILFSFPTPP
jgi:hypothetical protein